MAVAKNDSGTNFVKNTGGANVSIDLTTFTVSPGSNLALIAILCRNNTGVSGTTLNWDSGGTPQAMTSLGTATNTSSHIEIFKLANPATGNKTLSASWTTGCAVCLIAIAFSGADQTNVVVGGDTATATGSTNSPSVTVTTGASDITVAATMNSGNTVNSTDSQNELFRDATFDTAAASYSNVGGTSNAHSWTQAGGGNAWAAMGVHVLAASAAAGPVVPRINWNWMRIKQ
jgi:hypothetical protein